MCVELQLRVVENGYIRLRETWGESTAIEKKIIFYHTHRWTGETEGARTPRGPRASLWAARARRPGEGDRHPRCVLRPAASRVARVLAHCGGPGCCGGARDYITPGQLLARVCTSADSSLGSASAFPPYDPAGAEAMVRQFPDADPDLALRCYTSRLIGSRRDLVMHGGGNTSVKLRVRNLVGEEVDVLAVKGSGYNLDSIVPEGFPHVELAHLHKLLRLDKLTDVEMVNELRTHMLDSASPNPSVESLLHALIPEKFVDHSHADAIVALADLGSRSEPVLREAFSGAGIKIGIVPYAMPGIALSLVCAKAYRANPDIDAIVLLKHGLVTWGNTAQASYEMHVRCVDVARDYIARHNASLTGLCLPTRPQGPKKVRRELAEPSFPLSETLANARNRLCTDCHCCVIRFFQ